MKKHFLLALTILFAVPSLVSATSAENVTKRRPDKPETAQIQEIRQERRNNVAENHANRLEKRFAFYHSRLSNIMTRFQARLDLLQKEGKNISISQVKLDAAKAKLADAKVKGDAAIAAFKAIGPAKFSEQKTEVFAARDLANSARKLFLETHELLKLALKELKNITRTVQEVL
jgi:hypothetical protein